MAETERPNLKAQVAAIELLVINHTGFVDILRGLVAKGKRTPQELAMAEQYLPACRQAVLTMRFIDANADKIRSLTNPQPEASGDPY